MITEIFQYGPYFFIMDSLITWGSRGQKTVSLSSTEDEYMEVSKFGKEVLHIMYFFDFLNIILDLPIIIHVDNVAYIFTKNYGGRCTHHVDIRYHIIHEYIVDVVIVIIFVRSEEIHADLFKKYI